jgi:anti-anti-sigma factor
MQTHVENSEDTSVIIIDENQLLGVENKTFQTLVQNSIEQGIKNISVDLSNVKFISSWGIEGFLHAYKMCKNKNVDFSIKNVNATVMNVLSTLKLNEVIKII